MSDIRTWLESQGLAEHAELFEANDIGIDILGELEEADLKDLGLTLGDRKRVRAAQAVEAEVQAMGGLGDTNYAKGHVSTAQSHFADCIAMARRDALGQIEIANAPMPAWTTILVAQYRAGAEEAGHSPTRI